MTQDKTAYNANGSIQQSQPGGSSAKPFSALEIFRKRTFKPRESLTTTLMTITTKELPTFEGFHTMFMMALLLFVGTHPLVYYIQNERFFHSVIFDSFKEDFFWVLGTWPIFTLWCFNSFFIQKLLIHGAPLSIMKIWQYTCEITMFAASAYAIIANDWGITHTLFILFQSCIHFMKMHSYYATNVLLRKEYLQNIKDGQKNPSPYPNNVNFGDFWYYMIAPVLVYWYEYPRTEKIRWGFFFTRAFFSLMGLLAIYLVFGEIILPIIHMGKKINYMQAIILIWLPLFISYIIGFFTIWDCILNCYAEITRFADREFYHDWWNSTNYDEFSRKWNKIVHEFLFRHLYAENMEKYKLSKFWANAVTLAFSAILHQYVISMVFKKFNIFYFTIMVWQIPYIQLLKYLSKYDFKLRNFVFWTGTAFGYAWILVHFQQEKFA